MFRILATAIALAVPALPAIAQTSVHDTHVAADGGAVAGRSPHKAYRPIAATPACDRAAMHGVPAGKGHVFGRHAMASEACTTDRVAAADAARGTARE